MCTVSFLPARSGSGYFLATTRDERPRRPRAEAPVLTRDGARTLWAPRDPEGGGTWIVVDDHGRTLTLLNGRQDLDPEALEAEASAAPSRGLLVQDMMRRPEPEAVRARLTAGPRREKPFVLLLATPLTVGARLDRYEWDGRDLSHAAVAAAHVETSSGFEPDEVARVRGASFRRLLADWPAEVDLAEHMHDWHCSHRPEAPEGDGLSVCMHRSQAHSVSVSSVHVQSDAIALTYQPDQPCQARPRQRDRLARLPDPRA